MCYSLKASDLLSHNDCNINRAAKINPNTMPEGTQHETSVLTIQYSISHEMSYVLQVKTEDHKYDINIDMNKTKLVMIPVVTKLS